MSYEFDLLLIFSAELQILVCFYLDFVMASSTIWLFQILERLADLKSPWNCPHGRPTMRHLVDLTTVYKSMDEDETTLL